MEPTEVASCARAGVTARSASVTAIWADVARRRGAPALGDGESTGMTECPDRVRQEDALDASAELSVGTGVGIPHRVCADQSGTWPSDESVTITIVWRHYWVSKLRIGAGVAS